MKLTQREIEIMEFVSKGFTNLQIANRLGIAEQTVKNHLQSVYPKLKATNRVTAIIAYSQI